MGHTAPLNTINDFLGMEINVANSDTKYFSYKSNILTILETLDTKHWTL
jgi:hypothetical protein